MLNAEGYVVECTADNIFVVQQGKVLTPSVASGALAGVTPDAVLEIG